MKSIPTLTLTLNKDQADFLEAYAKVFGSNVPYVAMRFINEGIHNAIQAGMLGKARESFALAKKINRSKGQS